jgi:DNA-binding PadR family transcriptional regulator
MEEIGWLRCEWGESENNRRAKFYRLMSSGRRQLREEVVEWTRIASAMPSALEVP